MQLEQISHEQPPAALPGSRDWNRVLSDEPLKRPERKLAAILAADVVGYSRLMAADEEHTLQRLKVMRRDAVDPHVAEHNGRIVKTTGDGLLAEFASVVDAVRCAVEVQESVAERNAEVPEAWRMVLRIGINVGDIIMDGDDIYGDGVNIAARLESLAEPGGIYVSRAVRDQVRDKIMAVFEALGERQVKNMPRPVHVFRIRAADAPNVLMDAMALSEAMLLDPADPLASTLGEPPYNKRLTDKLLAAYNHAYATDNGYVADRLHDLLGEVDRESRRQYPERRGPSALESADLWAAFVEARKRYRAASGEPNLPPDERAAAFLAMKDAYMRWSSL